jgi:hypothetical protein
MKREERDRVRLGEERGGECGGGELGLLRERELFTTHSQNQLLANTPSGTKPQYIYKTVTMFRTCLDIDHVM